MRLAAVLSSALLCLLVAGCGDNPDPGYQPEADPTPGWDEYVTRHMGRAMGRLQFKIPANWTVTYQHDTIHPRIIVSDLADLHSPNVNVFVVGMTEVRQPDGPPAVWEAGNYSPIDTSLPKEEMERQKLLLDRKKVVDQGGRLGEGVTWQMTQTTPPIGDWESKWKYGADPGAGAVNRNKQRVNLFDEYMASHPGAPVDYYREFFSLGWGTHRPKLAQLHIYYRARNESIRRMFEWMIPTVQDYQFRDSDVTLLGGVIKKAHWDELTAQYKAAPADPAAPAGTGEPTETTPPTAPAKPSSDSAPASNATPVEPVQPAQAARP